MRQAFKLQTKNENFEVNFNKLDDSQRAAVEASGNNVVIRAAAGSGKTSTLITAIAAYRYERLNDRICAITYTRAARAEMEERLHSMGIFDVEVTTIHVWARNLLNDLSEKMGLTILFIAHDLAVVKYFSDRIAVMYFGKIVELASSEELFKHPFHPYTKSLLSAIPVPDPITERNRKRVKYFLVKFNAT